MILFRNIILLSLLLGVNTFNFLKNNSFADEQLNYDRVKAAYEKHNIEWENICLENDIKYPPDELFIRIFKNEEELELWASNEGEPYVLLKTYQICEMSGHPGPKRREGDLQIPEGVYLVELFNPVSKYHLSIKLNYPNKSDNILSNKLTPGSNIFIHGGCETVGCIPLTNDYIEELYTIAFQTYSNTGKIPVHIFPFRIEKGKNKDFIEKWSQNELFWSQLRPIYEYFDSFHILPKITVAEDGRYVCQGFSAN